MLKNLLCLLLVALFCQTGLNSQEIKEPSSKEDVEAALFGGVPNGKWKEGLLFDCVAPMPWLKSAANWFPGTEEIQPDEIRVTFNGTAPKIRQGQMKNSIFVELGNGDNFVFEMGEYAVSNKVQPRVSLNQNKHVFLTQQHLDQFVS